MAVSNSFLASEITGAVPNGATMPCRTFATSAARSAISLSNSARVCRGCGFCAAVLGFGRARFASEERRPLKNENGELAAVGAAWPAEGAGLVALRTRPSANWRRVGVGEVAGAGGVPTLTGGALGAVALGVGDGVETGEVPSDGGAAAAGGMPGADASIGLVGANL